MEQPPLIPGLLQARRILCVQPHYDDNDIGAGGTLASLSARGVELIYLTVTDDLVGVADLSLSPESASQQLRREQRQAGDLIGVKEQVWLGFPDASSYDYFELRRQIIRSIRLFRPDFLFTCDPWLPYEAHRDHLQTGLAVAEAAYLQSMLRLPSDPVVDSQYAPYTISGVAFYFTHAPNVTYDISAYHDLKHRAIDLYRAQLNPQEMAELLASLEAEERLAGAQGGFDYGEPLKIVTPAQLHSNTHTWKM